MHIQLGNSCSVAQWAKVTSGRTRSTFQINFVGVACARARARVGVTIATFPDVSAATPCSSVSNLNFGLWRSSDRSEKVKEDGRRRRNAYGSPKTRAGQRRAYRTCAWTLRFTASIFPQSRSLRTAIVRLSLSVKTVKREFNILVCDPVSRQSA